MEKGHVLRDYVDWIMKNRNEQKARELRQISLFSPYFKKFFFFYFGPAKFALNKMQHLITGVLKIK